MNALDYASFFENIKASTALSEYRDLIDENAKFKDPFHEVEGVENIYNIFQNMYLKLDNPKFKIIEVVEQKNIAYIKWNFQFKFKESQEEDSFEGVSRVEFAANKKMISHVDYWDASENLYEKIPVLSSLIRLVKRKIKS